MEKKQRNVTWHFCSLPTRHKVTLLIPPPRCHVLLEWPLTRLTEFYGIWPSGLLNYKFISLGDINNVALAVYGPGSHYVRQMSWPRFAPSFVGASIMINEGITYNWLRRQLIVCGGQQVTFIWSVISNPKLPALLKLSWTSLFYKLLNTPNVIGIENQPK